MIKSLDAAETWRDDYGLRGLRCGNTARPLSSVPKKEARRA